MIDRPGIAHYRGRMDGLWRPCPPDERVLPLWSPLAFRNLGRGVF